MAPPIIRVSRRWEPGLQVVRDGKTSPTQPAPRPASAYRLILVGPATVYQHPDIFGSREKAERTRDEVQQYLDHGRDLIGDEWEITDLFPSGRMIAYLPSVRVLETKGGGTVLAFASTTSSPMPTDSRLHGV